MNCVHCATRKTSDSEHLLARVWLAMNTGFSVHCLHPEKYNMENRYCCWLRWYSRCVAYYRTLSVVILLLREVVAFMYYCSANRAACYSLTLIAPTADIIVLRIFFLFCMIFKCYSSKKLIALSTLHEVFPTWYSFHS